MMGSGFMEWLINGLIILAGVIVFLNLTGVQRLLLKLKEESKNIYRQTKTDLRISTSSGNLGYDMHNELDSEAMDEVRERYNEVSSRYASLVQWISLFPLMGLLGTVLGLIPGLAAVRNEDFNTLYTALSTALYSTLFGLIASILLKIYVAHGPSRTVIDIENNLEENDRKYNYALGFRKLTDPDEER